MTDILPNLFPGIFSLLVQDTSVAVARLFLIAFGFLLAYLGFKRTLEPLIMVPMGIGMIAVNTGVSYLAWYTANSKCGVAKGMALNGTYVMWGVILSVVFLNQSLTQNLAIGSLLVLIGATLVAINPREFFNKGGNA